MRSEKITNQKFFRYLEIHRRLPASRAPKTDTFLIDIFQDIFLKYKAMCTYENFNITLWYNIISLNKILFVW